MNAQNRRAGFTLLEIIVAMSIFAIVAVLTLGMLKRSAETASMDLIQTHTENQVQEAVDSIVRDLKETSPALCTFANFNDAQGRAQTAICFPTARARASGAFQTESMGVISGRPVWQGAVVYAIGPDGVIFKYVDYSARAYTGPLYVSAVTANDITVCMPDGTVTAVFSRVNRPAAGGPQTAVPLQGRFRQLAAQMSRTTCWNCSTEFIPMPPGFTCPTCAQAGAGAIQLTVSSEIEHRTSQLSGTNVITTLTNEALSRNQN
ncbi:MAG TPA: type II secretion system protein [Planctomycetota bacterium]|nr:type II secretion system protein [Planctomycetota bacterium]